MAEFLIPFPFPSSEPQATSEASPSLSAVLSACSYPLLPPVGAAPKRKQPARKASNVKKATRRANAEYRDPDEGLDSTNNSRERRRLQIRTAQRAYRSRKENEVSQLVDHAARLESTISDLTNVFTTFTDWLISSGELTAHADIAKRTFETVEKARDLAKIVKVSDVNANSSMVRPPPRTLTAATRKPLPPNLQGEPIKPQPHIKHALYPSCSPPNQGHVDMTRFMDHLHWAILSRGTALLSDLAVPMQALNSHFCLMLAVTTRASLASHFDAALHAKLSLQPKHDKWRSVPFFPLGGAGTHYSWSTSCGQYSRRSRQWQWMVVPIGTFAEDMQEHLGGEWFDMQDLECFLSERGVHFTASNSASLGQSVDASSLLTTLLNKAVCLGQSAGFRRLDVEKALQAAAHT